jgi:DNA-binding NtrC family response regulator
MNAIIRPIESRYTLNSVIAISPPMRDAVKQARLQSMKQNALFIHGEKGSGKRFLARAIHNESPHGDQPFAFVRCDTLTVDIMEKALFGDLVTKRTGKFDEAGEGTILFARLEDLNPVAQERLVRTMRDGRYENGFHETRLLNCRLMATGNQAEIEKRVKLGYFSDELYEMLSKAELRMPALAERADDLPHLAVHFLQEFAKREGIEPPSVPYHYMELLMNVPWAENARQLRNHLESVMVLSHGEFTPEVLMEHFERDPDAATIKGAIQGLWSKIRGAEAKPLMAPNR